MFVVTRERLFPQPLGTTERSFSMCATCPPLLFYLREFFHLLTRGHYALQCSAMQTTFGFKVSDWTHVLTRTGLRQQIKSTSAAAAAKL
jgi:hypothetical protein